LGVIHIEKNVFENIFDKVMNGKRKTTDNMNAKMIYLCFVTIRIIVGL